MPSLGRGRESQGTGVRRRGEFLKEKTAITQSLTDSLKQSPSIGSNLTTSRSQSNLAHSTPNNFSINGFDPAAPNAEACEILQRMKTCGLLNESNLVPDAMGGSGDQGGALSAEAADELVLPEIGDLHEYRPLPDIPKEDFRVYGFEMPNPQPLAMHVPALQGAAILRVCRRVVSSGSRWRLPTAGIRRAGASCKKRPSEGEAFAGLLKKSIEDDRMLRRKLRLDAFGNPVDKELPADAVTQSFEEAQR